MSTSQLRHASRTVLAAAGLALLATCSSPSPADRAPTPGVTDHVVPTTGCTTRASETLDRQLDVGGLRREYLAHLPAGVPAGTPLPVVLYFHGGGRVPAGFLHMVDADSGFSRLADQDRFMAVYPLGNTDTVHGRTGWNTGNAPVVTYDPHADDVLFVSRLLDDLQARACVDERRVYATGFSSGAAMTAVLACRMAGRIAAFAPVEGAYYPVSGGCHPTRPASILSFQGTGDAKVPYSTGTADGMEPIPTWLAEWAARDRCGAAPTTFLSRDDVTGEHWAGCSGGAELVHYRIAGGQHAWPGGVAWPGAPAGTSTIDASSTIWAFAASHRLA